MAEVTASGHLWLQGCNAHHPCFMPRPYICIISCMFTFRLALSLGAGVLRAVASGEATGAVVDSGARKL